MPNPFISIVIPSYNEEANIARGALSEVIQFLDTQSFTYEIILSDDGSSDRTPTLLDTFAAANPRVKVIHNPHAGKGPTVKAGMLTATGDWRLFTDFDQSTPISELPEFIKHTKQFDVVVASREAATSQRKKEPLLRHIMGRVFNSLVQFLAVPGMKDTQCGFKLFSAKATTTLFPALYIYGNSSQITDAFTGAFDVELLYLARKYGFKIVEVGVVWKHYSSDRVSPLKDSIRMLRDIIRIRLADLMHKYPQKPYAQ